MKRILLILAVFQLVGCTELQQVVNQLPQTTGIGNAEIAQGLRDALNLGIEKQVNKLAIKDGFFRN